MTCPDVCGLRYIPIHSIPNKAGLCVDGNYEQRQKYSLAFPEISWFKGYQLES